MRVDIPKVIIADPDMLANAAIIITPARAYTSEGVLAAIETGTKVPPVDGSHKNVQAPRRFRRSSHRRSKCRLVFFTSAASFSLPHARQHACLRSNLSSTLLLAMLGSASMACCRTQAMP
ncbi:hypothetical protein GUJ93_ZPchr0009g1541 [Zizania palustris]|uniref:Uncharacterized protein n=1 Tax=Zizania palustris TaxID=103762 RepID=A0A8J5RQT4_ZIZPA|nr:hypothetical protein GUJ93_ZPchr0009g1541 [Zizania palustris]